MGRLLAYDALRPDLVLPTLRIVHFDVGAQLFAYRDLWGPILLVCIKSHLLRPPYNTGDPFKIEFTYGKRWVVLGSFNVRF